MKKRVHVRTWRTWPICLAAVLVAGLPTAAFSWNEDGHRLVVDKAIDSLPKPLKDFYKDRKNFFLENASDPTRIGRLTFEVDRLEAFPFEDLPEVRSAAVRKYGEDKLAEVGDAPWLLIETYEKLVEAYRQSDFDAVQRLSAELAFYVGELYVPANVSMDGDGDPTGQQGLRERFDSRLVEVYAGKLKFDTPDAIYLDRPGEYAVSIPRKSFIWVDNLLFSDYMSRQGVSSYDRFYYESMWLRLSPLLAELMRGAALDTASFWYTAWVEARKPELPKR